MKAEDLPLFELYSRLQEAGLPLGLDEYTQALKALQAGFGLPDQNALARLCRTLWVKSEEDENTFYKCFSEIFRSDTHPDSKILEDPSQISILRQRDAIEANSRRKPIRHNCIEVVVPVVLIGFALTGGMWLIRNQFLSTDPPASSNFEEIDESPPEVEPLPIVVEPLPIVEPNSFVPTSQLSPIFLISLAGSMLLSTTVAWLLIRQINIFQDSENTDDPENLILPNTIPQVEIVTTSNDEIQLAVANRKLGENNQRSPKMKILRQHEYFPLTRRQMKQGWRYLRRNSREGPKIEFDIAGTVHRIASDGMFIEPVMIAPRSNRTDLVLLLDQNGSMIPFETLVSQLVQTAVRAGRLGSAGTYYFHNCPTNYLYQDPLMQEPEPLDRFLGGRLSPKSVVMIVSDAGAARGGFNPSRVNKTQLFLAQLNKHGRYVVWLNPLPRSRWDDTSAGEIAKFVAMFEIDRPSFQSAIEVLRGRWKLKSKALEVIS